MRSLRLVALLIFAAATLAAQSVTPDMYRNLTWRTIGPEGTKEFTPKHSVAIVSTACLPNCSHSSRR